MRAQPLITLYQRHQLILKLKAHNPSLVDIINELKCVIGRTTYNSHAQSA
jgi:hypothetical protein